MIVDVHVDECDEDFIENIEDIIEDTMVQMFVLHPKDEQALKDVQKLADEHTTVFYSAPVKLIDNADTNCVGICIENADDINKVGERVVIIKESNLDDDMYKALESHKGIILNATKAHNTLENFLLSIGPGSVEAFETGVLKNLSMDRIVLQSNYPKYDFNDIYSACEVISEATFRSEQSIAAEATKNTMQLFGWAYKR